jgi:hypothetical protein
MPKKQKKKIIDGVPTKSQENDQKIFTPFFSFSNGELYFEQSTFCRFIFHHTPTFHSLVETENANFCRKINSCTYRRCRESFDEINDGFEWKCAFSVANITYQYNHETTSTQSFPLGPIDKPSNFDLVIGE